MCERDWVIGAIINGKTTDFTAKLIVHARNGTTRVSWIAIYKGGGRCGDGVLAASECLLVGIIISTICAGLNEESITVLAKGSPVVNCEML